MDYQRLELPYTRSRDQDAAQSAHHAVVVVGAGPVGLTLALDLAQRGVRVLVLDDDYRLSTGSRAICFAKRTLEIWDRLGCGQRMVDKGVSWNVGKVYFQDELVYTFDLLPEPGHRRPAFINLQQYYAEGYLYEQAAAQPLIELRWRHKVIGVDNGAQRVTLAIETPEGGYSLHADYVVACDGSRSPLRQMIGQESKGRVFRDRFLIADVKMQAHFPAERWFWFDPPFHRNQSALLHMQPDNVWRIDFQLGWDADPDLERQPDRVAARVQAMLGKDTEFELEWVSVYTFACLRMENFRHGRLLFAGDAAHGVSPFGARGANSGVQDVDNLTWKLCWVLNGKAPSRLLDSYAQEREYAADENLLNSTRATDFITPKSAVSRTFRDAVLSLSKDCAFARKLVNSGRLSTPTALRQSPLNTPDSDRFSGALSLGAPLPDAPVRTQGRDVWFLPQLGVGFTGIYFAATDGVVQKDLQRLSELGTGDKDLTLLVVGRNLTAAKEFCSIDDVHETLSSRLDAQPGSFFLVRPDQHLCARWRHLDVTKVRGALARALCLGE